MARTSSTSPAKTTDAAADSPANIGASTTTDATGGAATGSAVAVPEVGDGSAAVPGDASAGAAAADAALTVSDSPAVSGAASAIDSADAAEDSSEILIFPLKSYLDGKEIRHAGGAGYRSPKHDAVALIAAGLATDEEPKA